MLAPSLAGVLDSGLPSPCFTSIGPGISTLAPKAFDFTGRSEKGPASPPRALPSDAYDVATARAPRGAPPVARTVRVISMESAGLGARGAKDLSESRSSEEEP